MGRVVCGLDTSQCPPLFDNAKPGRVLIIDGDGPAYVVSATVKRLDTAVRNFQQHILKKMFMAQAESALVHLTASGSDKHGRYRVKAAKPYQGQRSNKSKPALLEPLREAMAHSSNWLDEFDVTLHRELEADDGMMIDAYNHGERGVIDSEDKDLRMTPYPYFENSKGQVMSSQPEGWVSLKYTPSGTPKLVGQGPMFFWAQMLMGDTADNVAGLLRYEGQLCGPVKAFELLGPLSTVKDAANLVLDGYRKINQNALAEGWLLWLIRQKGDNVLKYMRELPLDGNNRDFIEDCALRDWVHPREEQDDRD